MPKFYASKMLWYFLSIFLNTINLNHYGVVFYQQQQQQLSFEQKNLLHWKFVNKSETMERLTMAESFRVERCGRVESRKRQRSFVIETSSPPTRSDGKRGGVCALFIGLVLALHTPLWLAMVFYKEKVWEYDSTSEPLSATTAFLRFISRWVLDFTPWFANALLSIFLGVLFLYMGMSTIQEPTLGTISTKG